MKRSSAPKILAILLVTMLTGCSRLFFDWNTRTFRTTPDVVPLAVATPATPPRTNVASRPATPKIRKHKHKPPTSTADVKEMSIQPEITETPPAPPPPATISIATAGGSSDAAEKQIESTSRRLAHFDRTRLGGPTLATYDEANGFLNQGKQALAEKDYVAAAGFAQKASVLADQLQSGETAR